MNRILIIQPAFIGDVILATPLIEKLHTFFPEATLDFLLRKGNESLLKNNPFINEVIIWDKKKNKLINLLKLVVRIRASRYDLVVNVHRFFSSGFIACLSGGKEIVGFDKNPLAICYTHKMPHVIGNSIHETQRNLSLVEHYTDHSTFLPKLYPSDQDFENTKQSGDYYCIAPASVWFTKQIPKYKWIDLITNLSNETPVFLLGGSSDFSLCEEIKGAVKRQNIRNTAGKFSFLESAALMKRAKMNFVNDSSPMHLASAVNAPITAIFCSTVPEFGFTPLSENRKIVETSHSLDCRPCGLHGFKACPKEHFKCSEIDVSYFL